MIDLEVFAVLPKAEMARLKELRAYAELPEHWYYASFDVDPKLVPGTRAEHIAFVQGMCLVFSWTLSREDGGRLFRHLTFSARGDEEPFFPLCIAIARILGFEGPSDGWGFDSGHAQPGIYQIVQELQRSVRHEHVGSN